MTGTAPPLPSPKQVHSLTSSGNTYFHIVLCGESPHFVVKPSEICFYVLFCVYDVSVSWYGKGTLYSWGLISYLPFLSYTPLFYFQIPLSFTSSLFQVLHISITLLLKNCFLASLLTHFFLASLCLLVLKYV